MHFYISLSLLIGFSILIGLRHVCMKITIVNNIECLKLWLILLSEILPIT